MNDYIEDLFDSIDAAIFTGDSLHNKEGIERIKYYLDRWKQEIKNIEQTLKGGE